jgi:putative peptidoglycan lipid II flippase
MTIALSTISTMGMAGLVLANSAQFAFHAIVTGVLLWRALRTDGGLRGFGIGDTTLKAGAAALLMALVSYAVWWSLAQVLRSDTLLDKTLLLGVPTLVGGSLYAVLVWRMRLPEVELIAAKIRGRLGR